MPINEFEVLEKVTRKAQEKMSSLGVSTALDEEMEKLNNKANIQKAFNAIKFLNSDSIENQYNLLQKNEKIDVELQAAQDLKEKTIESLLLDNVTEFSDYNRDKSTPIADYSLSAKWKDMGLRLAAGIPQGTGLILDYAANHMNAAGKYLFSDTDKSYDEIFAKEQAEHNGLSKFANWITSPLDEQRAKINSQHLIDYDTLMNSYENEGLLSNLALTGSFALDLTPSVAETALMAVPGVGTARGLAALGATYLAEGNKEEQGKKLGKSANQIQGVTNTTDALDIIGAAGQAAFAVPELMMLKHAASVAKSPTRSVFDAINKTKAKQSIDEFVDNYALAPGKWLYKGAGLASRVGGSLGSMAAMEAVSEVGQESFEKIANEDWWDKSKEENLQDLKESAVLGAIGGATLGGGLKSVTAPIGYVVNKAKEREIFETTKQNAKELSETLNIKDMFSSSIEETTNSKGNVRKISEVDNPLTKYSPEDAQLRKNIFHNLSQVSLDEYDKNPDNNSETSPLNVNKTSPLLNEVVSLGAGGFLNETQEDGTEILSQTIIDESIGRAVQAVNDHIDSIIKTNPNTDTDEVISTLAEFKEKMKDNSALDYYVARQMLTNSDQVKQLLNRAIGEISDNSAQNGSEGEKLSSYENRGNKSTIDVGSAVKQGQKLADQNQKSNGTKEYTKEQLNNLKKASKFISELTGIEELAEEFDKTNTNNSKTSAVVTVQDLLSKINKTIDVLSEPIDKNDEFQKSRNNILNTSLSVMLTGTTTATGDDKKGLAATIKEIAQKQSEEGEKDPDGNTLQNTKESLEWWLNSHRAKYKLLSHILNDLEKENKSDEAIYSISKRLDENGKFEDVRVYKGRKEILKFLQTFFADVPEGVTPGTVAKDAKDLFKRLENNEKVMEDIRKFVSDVFGEHVFTTIPNYRTKDKTKKESLEEIKNNFKNTQEAVELEGGAIKAALDLIDPSSSKTNNTTDKNSTTNNERTIVKKDTQIDTAIQPKQEVKQDTPKNDGNSDEDTPPFDPVIDIYSTNKDKWSYLSNVTKSPLVLNIGGKEYPFVSVEHAYQSLKHNDFSKPMSEWTIAKVYSKDWNNSIKIKSELSENRDNDSNIKIMKYLLEERVKQDSKFEELLKATGNTELTHIRDNTIWKNKFPQLLMEIRDNLSNKNEQKQTTPKQGNSESKSFPNYSENFGENLGERGDHLKIDTTKSDWYGLRTVNNINGSDITIAFANDFSTAGEKSTTAAAVKANNGKGKYLRPGSGRDTKPAKMSNLEALNNPKETAKEIAEFFKEKYPNKKNFILNIAGNGIYSLKGIITQQELNSKMRDVLKELIKELPGVEIQVRSGGQTGMDLAGVVAAYSLGLDTTLHMPKGWKVRPLDGKDKTFDTKESFIRWVRYNNMYKLDGSSTKNPTSTQNNSSSGFKRSNDPQNPQTYQQKDNDATQNLPKEAEIGTSKDTNDIENFKEVYESNPGIEIDEEKLKELYTDTDNSENVKAIKENVENMLGSAVAKRNKKVDDIKDKDKDKEKERKEEIQSRFLNLEETLKVKDNPKSLLSVPNINLSSTIGKINTALKTSFGFKNELDISGFADYFKKLNVSKYLASSGKEYKDINNTITLFSNDNVQISAIIRALGALTDSRFSYSDFKDVKEKYPNLKNRREIPPEYLKYLLRGTPLSDIANDIGKRILSDIGLEINEKTTTLANADRIYQELGIVAIMSLEYLGLVNVTDVKYATFYNNRENENASEKRIILNLENVYTKEGSGNLSTAISFITNLEKDLRLDKSDHESTYSKEPFSIREFVKTKQGVFALTKKMYKAINAFLNTPFVVENYEDVKEFIDTHEEELKSFLGYTDLSEFVGEDRKLKKGVTPTILYGETGIKYSDIDSVLGKNLQVENSINHLKDLLNDGSAATDGIYFNKTFSSGRLWLQSATVNPQSNKLHRFLVTLKTQTKTEKLNNGDLSDSTYVAIAQAFGYKTDKKTGAVNVGKAIVNTEELKDKVIKALSNKGHIELGDGTELEIEEVGHALNALFNIEKFLKAKEENPNLTEFRHNIVEEVDGINNGIALKGLTFFVSPKTIKTLLSTGFSFFGELKDKVMPEKFSAEATTDDKKANPDKAWDTYEEFAIVTSKGFKKTTELLSEPVSIELANLKEREKANAALSEEQKEMLESHKDKAEVDYAFVNMANKFNISTKKEDEAKLQKLRTNVESFGKAMSGINNLVLVEEDSDIVSVVSKDARKLNKHIVIPSSYGSGLTSNIRSLTTFVVDNFGDWALKMSKDQSFEKSPEWGIVSAILDSLSTLNPKIIYSDYNGVEQELDNAELDDNPKGLKTFVLNNADGIGAAKVIINGNPIPMTLYDFINSHMEVVTRQGVKESRDTILPGYESVNNTINSIHNLFQIILTQKYDMLANKKLKKRGKGVDEVTEDTPIPTHLLTVDEHKEILETLRKDFPSITVDSKERFGENKEARHVGRISMANMDKVRTSTKDMGIYYPGIYLHSSTKGAKGEYASKPFSMGLTFKNIVFSSVGATPTAIMTQQKDGTDMTYAMAESADRNDGQLDINDIFDAILRHSSDGSSKASIISMYNRSQVNEALSSSQLYEQVALAAKAARDMSEIDEGIFNTVLSDKITNGINKSIKNYKESDESKKIVSPKEILVEYAKGLAEVMHMKYKISEVNKAVVRNLTTVASNMQNGHESDKAVLLPEREDKNKDLFQLVKNNIINDPYSEQDPKEYILKNLMLDITAPDIAQKLSSIEDMLNSIYDNRIPNNTKNLPNGIIEEFKTEIEELQKLIDSKILNIRKNLWNVGAKETAKYLTVHIKPLGEKAFSLEPSREEGRDVYQDKDEGRVASDTEAVEEAKEETIAKETTEENNSFSSNSPTKNNEIKESKEATTTTAKESKPNVESQGNIDVITRLADALEQLLQPRSKANEALNLGEAKANIPNRVKKVEDNINKYLKNWFNVEVDFRKPNKLTKFRDAFKAKLENFNVDEYLKDREGYLKDLFKDIVGDGSIIDGVYKEVLKSFENVDDTKVSDTSMDEFVSQIDLTTDKVSTTQEQMRNIDEANGRAMSKEFSNHLKGVLSELSSLASEAVNGVKVKYFKSKGKGHNEGEYLTKLREILIKEGIPLSKANFTGTAGLEETYGHELLHAITYSVIKAQAGGNPLTRELSMLHKRYLSVMTPSKLAKYINSGIPSKDLEVANRIIGHFENNTIEGLSEFIAIALSNEAVWNSLKDIEVKSDPNYDNMTFGERVVAKAMKMFNTFFNSIYRKYQDNDTMQKAMLVLATKIAAANSKAEYKIDKEMAINTLETADTLTTVANSLSAGLDKVDEVTSEKLNKLKDYVKSKGVKLVSVPKSRRRKYNSRWEEIRGLVAILASDVVGDKAAQAALSVAHDYGLHYNGVMQYVVSELSQMSDMKRKAEYLARKRGYLDTERARDIKSHTEELEGYFETPLTLAENQVLGEGMLDTDLSSLLDHYSIDELPDILNNTQSYKEKAYSDMLKEVDNNFKDRVGKYSKDDYKRYITNQANSLAYFMNFQSYRNEIEGAIGVKNPTMIAMAVGTGANLKPNKKVVTAIDKYVTLAALEYLESDVKDLIVDKLRTEPKGMEAMMNYHRTNKAESLEKNFGGNPALMIKGYRYDVIEDYIDIKIAPVSEESLLKSQGFRRVSKEPLRKSSDDNSEERAIYINDFISSTAGFNQQAVSYLGHTGRGTKLSDIYNDKILKGADVHTVEQEWYDSIVDLTKNSSLAARELMNSNYSPANFKDKKDSENIMVPIFDENGDLRDFAYLMSKKTKKDLLGLDTSLTKALSHMNARTNDKYNAQALNKIVADELFDDWDNANPAERKYHFVEMSFESKDPYIREIYKMLEPSFKNYLEEKFGGKIMVRASTMLNFFGQRDMDYRNTAHYREKDVPYKKLLLGSMDVARQLAKLSKMEIVLRFGSTIYNNFVANGMTLLMRGVPITSIIKDQIEGGRLLDKYLKDSKELSKLEAKKKAGGDVRDVEIDNLRRELERNPIRDMMEFGLFSTIQTFEDINLDDKDNSWTARQVRKYTVENENIPENVRELMQKGYDIAFVTDRTVIGRGLTKLVQMGDFVARYALYKHYMRDNKMSKKEALEKVSDEFINYDLPVNKVVKFANDYGFLFFTRYAIVSQKVMAMLASDRPVSAFLVVGLQSLFNIDIPEIFDGNVFTKDLGLLVSDPFTNLSRVLSPTGYDWVKAAYNKI